MRVRNRFCKGLSNTRTILSCGKKGHKNLVFYFFIDADGLKDFAYRIEMPLWPFVFSLAILLALTFLVVSFKAFRATQISLIKYLKYA